MKKINRVFLINFKGDKNKASFPDNSSSFEMIAHQFQENRYFQFQFCQVRARRRMQTGFQLTGKQMIDVHSLSSNLVTLKQPYWSSG
jgi:hypothetical protein